MNHSGEKGRSDPALYVMDEKETEQFKDIQETLGTLLLALNWHGWSREDQATLLFWIDALERRLIDIERDSR